MDASTVRALKIATCLAQCGYAAAVSQMIGLARAFGLDQPLFFACKDFCSIPGGRTRLMLAAKTGNLARATFLLDCGANARAATESGSTALHLAALPRPACTPGHVAVVRLLCARGADVNATDSGGSTPLYLAVLPKNSLDVVTALAACGADLERGSLMLQLPGEEGSAPSTPLSAALELGHWETAKRLVELGAKVDAPAGVGGHTALSLAIQRGQVSRVKVLLDLGASVTFGACTHVNIPPLHLAVMNAGMHDAAPGAHLEVFKELLARGASTAAYQSVWGASQSVEELVADMGDENYPLFKAVLDAHGKKQRPAGAAHGHCSVQ